MHFKYKNLYKEQRGTEILTIPVKINRKEIPMCINGGMLKHSMEMKCDLVGGVEKCRSLKID